MTGPRPRCVVVCFGTATEIGKTWCGAETLRALREAGATVAARKPLQSFDPHDPAPTDAEVLAAATAEDPHTVCPPKCWFPVALAPPMAAAALCQPVPSLEDVSCWIAASWPRERVDVGWVETVGGPRSPLAADGDGVDVGQALHPDHAVLVGDATLGTINSVRLAAAALAAVETEAGAQAPLTVVLNRYDGTDDLQRRNRTWLADRDGLDVVTTPSELAARLAR
jgi:dethiobiotin synthetase